MSVDHVVSESEVLLPSAPPCTDHGAESQEARDYLLGRIRQGGVTSFDMPFIFSDRGKDITQEAAFALLQGLVNEGLVKVKNGTLPYGYSVTMRYYLRQLFKP